MIFRDDHLSLKTLPIFLADAPYPVLEKQSRSAHMMLLTNVVPGYLLGTVIYRSATEMANRKGH